MRTVSSCACAALPLHSSCHLHHAYELLPLLSWLLCLVLMSYSFPALPLVGGLISFYLHGRTPSLLRLSLKVSARHLPEPTHTHTQRHGCIFCKQIFNKMLSPQSMFACGDRLEHSSGKHSQKTVFSSMLRMATATVSVSLVSLMTIIRSNHSKPQPHRPTLWRSSTQTKGR